MLARLLAAADRGVQVRVLLDDSFTMHVQANSSSCIQHYAQDTDNIVFYLLGYWTDGTYVERWGPYSAGSGATWVGLDISADVPADRAARIEAAAVAVRELGYSKTRALEFIGETDPAVILEEARREKEG